MSRTTFSLKDEVNEQIKSRLSYGDSKSAWLRHAVQLRLQNDPILDQLYEPDQYEERIKFVEKAVKEAVDRELNRAPMKGTTST